MARKPRRNHLAQFKAKVALEVITSDKTLAEIAQKYDIHANQIVDWKQQLLGRSAQVFGSDLSTPPVDLKILHAKIGQLALENDFLESALCKAWLLSKKMITKDHELSISAQARLLNISRSTTYPPAQATIGSRFDADALILATSDEHQASWPSIKPTKYGRWIRRIFQWQKVLCI